MDKIYDLTIIGAGPAGLYAARNLLGNGNYDPWSVNVGGEYLEEIHNE